MSNVLTRFQDFVSKTTNLDKTDLRLGNNAAFEQRKTDSARWVSEEILQQARQSFSTGIQVPVFDYTAMPITNTRTLTIPDNQNTTRMVAVNMQTYTTGFTLGKASSFTNYKDYQDELNRNFKRMIKAFGDTFEDLCIADLDAAKTQVSTGLNGEYVFAADAITVPRAARGEFFAAIEPIMENEDFEGPFDIVANNNAKVDNLTEIAEFGQQNERNKAYQLDGKDFYFSRRITPAVGFGATGYIIQQGTLGLVTRVERDAYGNIKSDKAGVEFGTVTLPGLGIQAGLMYTESLADLSGRNGAASADHTRGVQEGWSFSVDIGLLNQYVTDPATRASGILKYQTASA